ncbi:MAG TPA: AAA family ATPase [SAR324 cluster bacterium]|jgi:MoxR-like ATPase|nr:AAA family ATPase [Deltaproteobacteria bacterium]MDP6090465.1 AAA family ATPase [SAR324 cluster bacterium]MDP7127877.1 AAA family ATPase [Candidatus Neomarinimicrobiota bacterium]MDP6245061.1 AAA family ATPase [SAR324 cluster bacterium]MDP6329328.1 AAA family ATPase [SAR324 cluster bacterium]|tara:strand:+ start:103 stop:1128 length:1026 start_codon:yes stop_codon:yes gene_type:complete
MTTESTSVLGTFLELKEQLKQNILGQQLLVDRLLLALLADGHMLVEGAPGLAKTRAVKMLGEAIEGNFHRIQFTPDLLPSDVTGTEIYRPQEATFVFQRGPVFHNLVLADEINRAPAKVQSALLEAMGERQVTVGRETYQLPELFLVMATQNPIEQEGTYPLPEAQLDRFLMQVNIDYPAVEDELKIVQLVREENKKMLQGHHQENNPNSASSSDQDRQIYLINQQQVMQGRSEVLDLYMSPEVERYLVELVQATRYPERYNQELSEWIEWGGSPRASLALDRCSKAHAWLQDRDFVTPEDLQQIAPDVLRHRILLTYGAESKGLNTDEVLQRILELVPVP